jgi:hypothetical protein
MLVRVVCGFAVSNLGIHEDRALMVEIGFPVLVLVDGNQAGKTG